MKNNLLLFLFLLSGASCFAQINTFPHEEDFESGANGWTVNGSTTSWELNTPAGTVIQSAASGSNAWVTNATGNYDSDEDGWVESPYFDFTSLSCPYISMSIWWESEFSFDGAVLQSSIDSGATWQNVGAVGSSQNWYNDGNINGDPGGQGQGWTGRNGTNSIGGSNGWVTASHALNNLAGESSIKFRIAFGSDGSVEDEGFAFDDIHIFNLDADLEYVSLDGLPSLPAAGCAVMSNLTATAVNTGCNTLATGTTVTFTYSDGINLIDNPVTLTTDLNVGDTLTTTFSVNWTSVGVYTPKSWVSVAGDLISGNDTVSIAGTYEYLGGNIELAAIDNIPSSGCNLGVRTLSAILVNAGCSVYTTGSTIQFDYNDGTNTLSESIVLQNDLNIGDSLLYVLTTPIDFSASGSYNPMAYITAPADVVASDDTLRFSTFTRTISISSFPYFQDFEGTSYWGLEDYGTNATWELGTPAGTTITGTTSGVNAWVTNDSGDYNNGEDNALISPCFNFSSLSCDPWIEFSLNYNIENSWDGLVLQSSTDGGATWQNVGADGDPNNWFNDNTIGADPGGQEEGWTGNSNGWVTATHILDGLAGQPDVKLRFAFGSDGTSVREGVAIDDIRIFKPDTDLEYVSLDGLPSLPTSGCDVALNLMATTVNIGCSPIPTGTVVTFTYSDGINLIENPVTLTTDLNTGDTLTAIFSVNWSTAGFYMPKSWVSVAGDLIALNDTISVTGVYEYLGPNIKLAALDSIPSSNCNLGVTTLSATMVNIGCSVYTAGSTIQIDYNDGINTLSESIVLQNDLNSGDSLVYAFTAPVDFSTIGSYTPVVYITAATDVKASDDTLHFNTFVNAPSVSSFPYLQDFEGVSYWVVEDYEGNATWELGTPAGTTITGTTSGINAWVTNASGDYNGGEDNALVSPCFDFSSFTCDPIIEFSLNYNTENSWDGLVLQSSIDGGTTWQNVGADGDANNWFNDNTINGDPGGQEEGWTGRSNGWVTATHALIGLAGQSGVKLRFAFASDGGGNREGVAIDDIRIYNSDFDLEYATLDGLPTLPAEGCDLTLNLTATTVNIGCNTLATGTVVTFTYSDGINLIENPVTLTADLNTGDTLTATFSVNWSAAGVYTPESWISVAGDAIAINDTITDLGTYKNLGNNLEIVALDSVPASNCGLGTAIISATAVNIGCSAFAAGSIVQFDYNDGVNSKSEMILLRNDLNVGDSLVHIFSLPADFSNVGNYIPVASVTVAGDIDASNDTLRLNTITHAPSISSFPYLQDFEGASYWSVEDYRANATWELGTPAGTTITGTTSGVNAWVTNVSGNYNSGENNALVSPCFDFSSFTCDPWIEFSLNYNAENSWDGLVLQSSVDGGATWQNVGADGDANNWFNDNTISGDPGGQEEGWTGSSNGWVTAAHALTNLAGASNVKLRFAFGSDGTGVREGVAIDDIRIHDGLFFLDQVNPDDYVLCAGDSIQIMGLGDGLGNSTYDWSTGDSLQNIWVATAGDYILTRTDANNCVATDTMTISGNSAVLDLGADTAACESITLDAGQATAYNWSTGETTRTITVSNSTDVSVEVTNSGCPAQADTITLTIHPNPVVDLGADTTLCTGDSIILDAGVGYTTYDWSTGGSIQTETISATGNYTVEVVDANGCAGTDAIAVGVCSNINTTSLADTDFEIYPNPNTGQFNLSIHTDNTTDLNVEILDINGRVIYQKQLVVGTTTYTEPFNVSDLAAGVYLLRLTSSKASATKRLVINR